MLQAAAANKNDRLNNGRAFHIFGLTIRNSDFDALVTLLSQGLDGL